MKQTTQEAFHDGIREGYHDGFEDGARNGWYEAFRYLKEENLLTKKGLKKMEEEMIKEKYEE